MDSIETAVTVQQMAVFALSFFSAMEKMLTTYLVIEAPEHTA